MHTYIKNAASIDDAAFLYLTFIFKDHYRFPTGRLTGNKTFSGKSVPESPKI